ncbi:carotenoid biosynthesis protein [Desulforamulus ruminis]|uniref:Carotenoid biosynthesis protein n=1 Tax=Desulforamulus ruminis (strain ATCC 23193 / DSM 2154 / NCIMB 8452 / DL) TaxID=696281 RepID=F6DKS5_DESRL|nr:carotenoid biosynthesis protein [Desulforamulus ruminis]AEG60450.1 hypothetical protein Desru_2201 [Desulforamulus ruminis DSM 2154]
MPYGIVIPLLVGIAGHLLVKIYNVQGGEAPGIVHLLSAVSFIAYSFLHGIRYQGYKQTIWLFLVSFLVSAVFLGGLHRQGYMFFSSHMLLFGFPLPVIFWFFALIYNSIMLAEWIVGEVNRIIDRTVQALLASFISSAYLLVACPLMWLRKDWGFTVEGSFYHTPIDQYFLWLGMTFAIALLYERVGVKMEKREHGLGKNGYGYVLIFYAWLMFSAMLTAFIYELEGLFLISLFGMGPYILLYYRRRACSRRG